MSKFFFICFFFIFLAFSIYVINNASAVSNNPGSGKLYWITGNLTLNSNITVNKSGVIFVDGDLFINTNQTNDSATAGLVFIVKGTIYIAPSVTTVNAFLINYTGFCSAYQSGTSLLCQDNDNPANQNFLTINGSVISLNPSANPQFVRKKSSDTQAAETINYQPKYLIILKDIFSRDLKIWKEVQ